MLGDRDRQWTAPSALFFAVTTMTTIGYGDVAPDTDMGRGFTVLYSLGALAVTMTYLAKVGSAMAAATTYTFRYSRRIKGAVVRKSGGEPRFVSPTKKPLLLSAVPLRPQGVGDARLRGSQEAPQPRCRRRRGRRDLDELGRRRPPHRRQRGHHRRAPGSRHHVKGLKK